MATRMQDLIREAMASLRIHPISKWIRASVGDTVVVDTRAAHVVWEPRRVVPTYAVPVADLAAELLDAEPAELPEHPVRIGDGPPVLTPETPFAVHSTPGRSLTLRTAAGDLPGAGFAPDDPDLDGHVLLDWDAFDQWYEEEQVVMAHPHDPFDRIDCLVSSRHVEISLAGVTLADSRRPTLLYETPLPVRYYLPREDVAMELLEPADHTSVCAYKGHARYWSALVGGEVVPNLAWSYEDPLDDAVPVQDLVCFFTERLDVRLDGVDQDRAVTPWS
ncbi:DUF427 domain-containing protein [Nocardioides coralli]|uniref:DUF427 domain-containing protein n=1 Tax=Nocardioides coralli TaxID=2872154 RepID=UPI001CA3F4B9|nr:DUF427 domain-containing protein [Nocardioides coralli]QZY29021.1 DUF427 domain-containing protein [Nocardioides coralli]